MRGAVDMATQADTVGLRGRELAGIADQGGIARFGVLAGRAVARFASLTVPTPFLFRFHHYVRSFLEGVVNILVTGLAGLGSDVSCGLIRCVRRRRRLGFGFLRGSLPHEPERSHKEWEQGRRAAALKGADHLISPLQRISL